MPVFNNTNANNNVNGYNSAHNPFAVASTSSPVNPLNSSQFNPTGDSTRNNSIKVQPDMKYHDFTVEAMCKFDASNTKDWCFNTGFGEFIVSQEILEKMQDLAATFSVVGLAGGFIRDQLFNVEVKDIDLFVRGFHTSKITLDCLEKLGYIDPIDSEQDGYNHFYSFRKDDYNLVVTQNHPSTEIESFSCSASEVGLVMVATAGWNQGEREAQYTLKFQASKLAARTYETGDVYVKLNNRNCYGGLLRYINKMSAKPWAEGQLFKYWFNGQTLEERICPKGGFKFDLDKVIGESGEFTNVGEQICLFNQVLNPFVFDKEEYEQWVLDIENMRNRVTHLEFELWSYDGTHLFKKFNLELLNSLVQIGSENLSDHDLVEMIEICSYIPAEIPKEWREVKKVLTNELKGWDFLEKINPETYFSGNKRQAFKNCKHKELYLLSLGYKGQLFDTNMHMGWVSAAEGFAQGKLKFIPEKWTDVEQVYNALRWTNVMGAATQFLSEYWINHFYNTFLQIEIPEKYRAQVAKNRYMMTWIFDRHLEVVWDKKTAKECVLATLASKYGEDIAEEAFENPSILKVKSFISVNPQTVDLESPVVPNQYHKDWSLSLLHKKDKINLYIGDLTGCCQHLSGAGHLVVKQGWNDPRSCNYVVRSPSGKILSHFWCWEAQDGTLVIDSIEGRESVPLDILTELLRKFIAASPRAVVISDTHYGFTKSIVVHLGGGTNQALVPIPYFQYGYMDAKPGHKCFVMSGEVKATYTAGDEMEIYTKLPVLNFEQPKTRDMSQTEVMPQYFGDVPF